MRLCIFCWWFSVEHHSILIQKLLSWNQSQTKLLHPELSTLRADSSFDYTTIDRTASVFFLSFTLWGSLTSFHLLSSYHHWEELYQFHFTDDPVISALKRANGIYWRVFSLQLVRRKPSPPPLFKTFPHVIFSTNPILVRPSPHTFGIRRRLVFFLQRLQLLTSLLLCISR